MSIITALTKITAAVSDADVMIKLCKAGYLSILGEVFERLYVPAVVFGEVINKITTEESILSLEAARSQGWLVVIAQEDLEPEQMSTYASFIVSYEEILDWGELHAAALANEFNINVILSDDHSAKNIIEHLFQKEGLAYWEVLYLYGKINGLKPRQLEAIHNAVNQVVDRPIGVPFNRLMKRAEQRILEIISKKRFPS